MKTIKLKMKDTFTKQNIVMEDVDVGDSWPEQIELFFQFLYAQGFTITYASFLEVFGDKIRNYHECFAKEE